MSVVTHLLAFKLHRLIAPDIWYCNTKHSMHRSAVQTCQHFSDSLQAHTLDHSYHSNVLTNYLEIEPVIQVPRKIPHSMMEPLKAELDRMINLGVIRKLHINEATDWVHNLVLVRKPNGKLRVCLDPRTINKALCFNIHNAKTFNELTSRIGKVMYVSKIDANSGFWTLPIGEGFAS